MGIGHALKEFFNKIKAFSDRINLLHDSFEIGILLKGINGMLEIVGGGFLIFLTPGRMRNFTNFLIEHGVSEDPKDRIAAYILRMCRDFSVHTQYFAIYYLLSHGIIKVILVYLLWRRRLWAYPLAVVVLFGFVVTQVYMFSYRPSFWVGALTILDVLLIFLTLNEYNSIKKSIKTYSGEGKKQWR